MHHGEVTPEIAQGLLALQGYIKDAGIPASQLDETLNFAVWNIREFGKTPRSPAALHLIAEILGQFDLVALVELRDDLEDLKEVLGYLGDYWDIVYSDWIPDSGGNHERIGYLFDTRAVIFNGLAAEADAPRGKKAEEYLAARSFWRAPYLCSFRSGNFDFLALTTHARWGDSLEGRQAELQMLADWIDTRFKSQFVEDHDLIVAGDFNIPQLDDALFKALTSRGLEIPECLRQLKCGDQILGGTNLAGTARYDQILHRPTQKAKAGKAAPAAEAFVVTAGGTLNFFQKGDGIKALFPDKSYTLEEFTFQLSDHLPLWVQIKTDIEGQRLNQIIQASRAAKH